MNPFPPRSPRVEIPGVAAVGGERACPLALLSTIQQFLSLCIEFLSRSSPGGTFLRLPFTFLQQTSPHPPRPPPAQKATHLKYVTITVSNCRLILFTASRPLSQPDTTLPQFGTSNPSRHRPPVQSFLSPVTFSPLRGPIWNSPPPLLLGSLDSSLHFRQIK